MTIFLLRSVSVKTVNRMSDIRFYPTLRIVTHPEKKVKQFKEKSQKRRFFLKITGFTGYALQIKIKNLTKNTHMFFSE